jgi:hypothetical protein
MRRRIEAPNKELLSFRIDVDLMHTLKQEADDRNISLGFIIRQALRDHLILKTDVNIEKIMEEQMQVTKDRSL